MSAYNAYRVQSGQQTVAYTTSNSTPTDSSKYDVSSARANLAQAESRVEIQNINERMNDNQQDIEMVINDYRSRNPNADQGTMNQDLRTKNSQYGGLLDDQQNLQEQKRTLEDKIIQQNYLANNTGDINKDADKSFNQGLSISSSVMDDRKATIPVTYSTVSPEDRAPTGTLADQNFGKVDQSTIDSIYARQNQDRVDNAVQSNYFWQLRAGQVPIGKALYEPETTNTYFSGDTKLPEMQDKAQRMELTRMYLDGAGQTMDTPIGNVKTSPTKYTEARNIAKKSELLNLPMGDLNNFRPSLTKDGDYSGYIKPSEYRKQITTPKQSEFPSQQGDWNFYEAGFGRTYTMSPKLSQFESIFATGNVDANNTQFLIPKDNFVTASTGVMSFENTKLDDSKVIMGSGNVPSMLGGINLFMFGGSPMKGLTKEIGKLFNKADDVITGNKDGVGFVPTGGEFGSELTPAEGMKLPELYSKIKSDEESEEEEKLDWSGNKPSEIPDDIYGQIAKGGQAEVFNVAQSLDSLATGKDVEYAPTVTGDLLDAFGYDTSTNKYRDYTDDFGTNVGIFFESSGTTLAGYQDKQVQDTVNQQLTQAGEKFQKYPIYYIASGAVEIGTMFVPVGKVGTALKYTAKGLVAGAKASVPLKAGVQGARVPVIQSMKLAMQTPETKVMNSINAILPDGSMTVKKVILTGADKGIYVKQNTVDASWLNKLTTKVSKLEKVEMLADSKGNPMMAIKNKASITEYVNLSNVQGVGSSLYKGLEGVKKAEVTGWTMQVYAETGSDVAQVYGRVEKLLAREGVPRVYAVAKQTDKIDDKVGLTIQIPARIADSPKALSAFTTNLRKQLYTYDKRGTIDGSRNLGELKVGSNIKGKVTDWRRFLKQDSISYRYGLTSKRDELQQLGTKIGGGQIEMLNPAFNKSLRLKGGYNVDNNLDLFQPMGKQLELTDIKYVTTKGKARTDEFQGIEKIGKTSYLANLSFESTDKGMGYVVMNVANTVDSVSFIPKKFKPDVVNNKLVIPTKEGLFNIAQWGAVYTVSGKTLRSNEVNDVMFKLGLKKAIKDSNTGMVDEEFLKKLGGTDSTRDGMNLLFKEAVDKKLVPSPKFNVKAKDNPLPALTKIFEKGNFDDMFKRDAIFATPNSARPTYLSQGANPLFKDSIDNQIKYFGRGNTNDAGLLARAKDTFWYKYAEPEKLADLPVGTKFSDKVKKQNMMAFASVRDSSLSYLGGTKFGKKFASSYMGKKTIDAFGKPKQSLAEQEIFTINFFKTQDEVSALKRTKTELQQQELSALGDFSFAGKIQKIDKEIVELNKKYGLSDTDRWLKIDATTDKVTSSSQKTFSAMQDTTSVYDDLLVRAGKIEESKAVTSSLRTNRDVIGSQTDDVVNALNLDKANIVGVYDAQIKVLQSQKKSLFNLSGGQNITGFKTVQQPTANAQKMLDLGNNPYGMLIKQFNKKAPTPAKPQSTQFISSTKKLITKLEKQAKTFRDDIDPRIKEAKERVKVYEQIVSTEKMTQTRATGKKVLVEIDKSTLQQMKNNLRVAKDDVKLLTDRITNNKGYQDTLTDIASLKRKVNRMESTTTKTVRVQASGIDSLKAKQQIADIDASILKLQNSMKNDPKLLSISDKIFGLKPNTTKAWDLKVAKSAKQKDKTFVDDWNVFMKENVKISKDTNTYRYLDEVENMPVDKYITKSPDGKYPDINPKGKKKSKSTLNDVFKTENDMMADAVKKYNTKKESADIKKFQDKFNNDPLKPQSTIMADGTPLPKADLGKTDTTNIIAQFRTDTGRGSLPSGISFGAPMFSISQAFAQTQQQSSVSKTAPIATSSFNPSVQATTPNVQSAPSPRIGTSNLFTPSKAKTDQKVQSIFGSFKQPKPLTQTPQKTGTLLSPFTGQRQTPVAQTDILQETDQLSKQIGATAQALDQQFRVDTIQVFDKSSLFAPKTNAVPTNVKPAKRVPAIIPAPAFPITTMPPINLLLGGQRKGRKKKKKKEKGEATAWAVPDVWFDASGYYFSKGNAYVTGAKAKSPPKAKAKSKRIKKSKR